MDIQLILEFRISFEKYQPKNPYKFIHLFLYHQKSDYIMNNVLLLMLHENVLYYYYKQLELLKHIFLFIVQDDELKRCCLLYDNLIVLSLFLSPSNKEEDKLGILS